MQLDQPVPGQIRLGPVKLVGVGETQARVADYAFRGGRMRRVRGGGSARVEDAATRPDRSGPAALALRYSAVPRTARSPDRRPPTSPNPYAAAI